MALVVVETYVDRFENLAVSGSSTLLVLTRFLGIEKNDTLRINEINTNNQVTGRYMLGIVSKVVAGEPFILPNTYNDYYITNLSGILP